MTFKLTVTDDAGLIDTDTTNVIVKSVNEAPTTVVISNISTIQNKAVNFRLNATDPENDPIQFSLVSNPSNGTLSGTCSMLTYIPNKKFSGVDSFSFRAKDGKTESKVAVVDITVKGISLVDK